MKLTTAVAIVAITSVITQSSESFSATLADGAHHDVGGGYPDYPFEGLAIWDGPAGAQTSATLHPGARIEGGLELRGTSSVTAIGTPEIGGDVSLYDSSSYYAETMQVGTLYLNDNAVADFDIAPSNPVIATGNGIFTADSGQARSLSFTDGSRAYLRDVVFRGDRTFNFAGSSSVTLYNPTMTRVSNSPLNPFGRIMVSDQATAVIALDPGSTVLGIEYWREISAYRAEWVDSDGTERYAIFAGNPDAISFAVVPEPSTSFLLGVGLFCLGALRSRGFRPRDVMKDGSMRFQRSPHTPMMKGCPI